MSLISQMFLTVNDVLDDETISKLVVHKIIKQFGGDTLYVPMADYSERNRLVLELYRDGIAIKKIASKFRLCKSTVYNIVNNRNKE